MPPFLLYHPLDPTGAACNAGQYAFLATPGDLDTVLQNLDDLAGLMGELRVHPAEASGTDHSGFYDTIAVGDRVDFQIETAVEAVCTYRLTITAVPPVAPGTPRVFGFTSGPGGPACDLPIERTPELTGWSGDRIDYGLFRWHPGAGAPAPFPWIQCSPPGWPTGAETPWPSGRMEFDFPLGVTLMERTERAPDAPDDLGPDTPVEVLRAWERTTLCDPATGSFITFEDAAGAEVERVVHPPAGDPTAGAALHALFDQIAASVRIVEDVWLE